VQYQRYLSLALVGRCVIHQVADWPLLVTAQHDVPHFFPTQITPHQPSQ